MYYEMNVVKSLPHQMLFWLAVAAAATLVAPYVGVHILTSPPTPQAKHESTCTDSADGCNE